MKRKKLKSEYYWRLIEDAKGDSSKAWKAIKETLPSNYSEINAISSDCKLETDPKSIAQTLNDHFLSIGKRLSKAFRGTSELYEPELGAQMDEDEISSNIAPGSRFVLHPVTTEYAERQLSQLKTNKAVGLDKISARLLRDSAKTVAPALRSFENGQYPSTWKCAKVTALFKQGNRTDKDNYRPISILPTVSKVIERAVHSQHYDFLDTNKLLSVNQFGFRRGRSIEFALAQFTDEVLENIDNGLVTGAVYIDLKKAFDTVDHTIMIKKLKTMGISSTNMAWFHSYLSSCCQKTVIGQAMSATRKVTVGVPQGSIVGPLLFSIYINDLPACLQNTTVTLFADDTALYCSSQSAHELQTLLNEDLNRLAQWLHQHAQTNTKHLKV